MKRYEYVYICEFHVFSLMNCFLTVVKSRSVPASVKDDSTNQEVYSRPERHYRGGSSPHAAWLGKEAQGALI